VGDDWCRMRVKSGVSQNEVQAIIEEAAFAYRAYHFRRCEEDDDIYYGNGLINPYVHSDSMTISRDEALTKYRDMLDVLNQLVNVEETANGRWICHRMSAIGRNDIFPYEWRIEAYRSYLPYEVPSAVDKWRNYILSIQNGGYVDFLLDWFLYRESYRAFHFWQVLQETTLNILSDTDNHKLVKSFDTLEFILTLEQPIQYSAPGFNVNNHSSTVGWQTDERYLKLKFTFEQLHDIRHKWNQNIKKKRYKHHRSGYPFHDNELDFGQYLQSAQSSFVASLFHWLQNCVDDGVGLYLWA